ncbi:hypothetical protein BDW68DRAFT_158550 [Aspergillus falconensis]
MLRVYFVFGIGSLDAELFFLFVSFHAVFVCQSSDKQLDRRFLTVVEGRGKSWACPSCLPVSSGVGKGYRKEWFTLCGTFKI